MGSGDDIEHFKPTYLLTGIYQEINFTDGRPVQYIYAFMPILIKNGNVININLPQSLQSFFMGKYKYLNILACNFQVHVDTLTSISKRTDQECLLQFQYNKNEDDAQLQNPVDNLATFYYDMNHETNSYLIFPLIFVNSIELNSVFNDQLNTLDFN